MAPPVLDTRGHLLRGQGSALVAPSLRLVDPSGPDPALALIPLPGSCLRALGTWAYLVPLLSSSSVLLPRPQAPRGQRCFPVCAASSTPSPGPARVNTAGMAQEPAREAHGPQRCAARNAPRAPPPGLFLTPASAGAEKPQGTRRSPDPGAGPGNSTYRGRSL